MDTKTAQQLFRDAGYYKAAIDGLIGPATRVAVKIIETNARSPREEWPWPRRIVAAAQRCLAARGLYAGSIDGLAGPQTAAAVAVYHRERLPKPSPSPATVAGKTVWPRRRDARAMIDMFGEPGGPQATAGRCKLPFDFIIAWDDDQRIRSFACNSRVADDLTAIFAEAARHYGEAEFRRLRLDRWGGCFADRKMRGSRTTTSTHAWGIAVDLDPENNQLRWGRDRAQLALPEYDAWWRIVEAHGAVSLGRMKNYDFMHWQFCKED